MLPAFGADRIVLELQRLRMDFPLPCPGGEGVYLTGEQLAQRQRQGITEYNVTDETESFNRTASIFLGEQVKGAVNRIELG